VLRPTDLSIVRSPATRVLHLLLLLAVLHQLIDSQFMDKPLPGEEPSLIFILHGYIGLASVGVVAAFWVWTMIRQGETSLGRLLPWFSLMRLRDVAADAVRQLHRLARLQAPTDEDGAMTSAVHGLGLLTVTMMVATGTLYYFTEGSPFGRSALSMHKLFANVMWVYLVAHAGLAVLHHLLGSDIFSRMFWSRRRSPVLPISLGDE
jgi:cytochrome b561